MHELIRHKTESLELYSTFISNRSINFYHAHTNDKPSLLKVISNERIVDISQSSLDYTFHSLDDKRLMLSVNVLNPLKQK